MGAKLWYRAYFLALVAGVTTGTLFSAITPATHTTVGPGDRVLPVDESSGVVTRDSLSGDSAASLAAASTAAGDTSSGAAASAEADLDAPWRNQSLLTVQVATRSRRLRASTPNELAAIREPWHLPWPFAVGNSEMSGDGPDFAFMALMEHGCVYPFTQLTRDLNPVNVLPGLNVIASRISDSGGSLNYPKLSESATGTLTSWFLGAHRLGRNAAQHALSSPSEAFVPVGAPKGQCWGWRAGANMYALPLLRSYLPGTTFVHVIRDVRDVVMEGKFRAVVHLGSAFLFPNVMANLSPNMAKSCDNRKQVIKVAVQKVCDASRTAEEKDKLWADLHAAAKTESVQRSALTCLEAQVRLWNVVNLQAAAYAENQLAGAEAGKAAPFGYVVWKEEGMAHNGLVNSESPGHVRGTDASMRTVFAPADLEFAKDFSQVVEWIAAGRPGDALNGDQVQEPEDSKAEYYSYEDLRVAGTDVGSGAAAAADDDEERSKRSMTVPPGSWRSCSPRFIQWIEGFAEQGMASFGYDRAE